MTSVCAGARHAQNNSFPIVISCSTNVILINFPRTQPFHHGSIYTKNKPSRFDGVSKRIRNKVYYFKYRESKRINHISHYSTKNFKRQFKND